MNSSEFFLICITLWYSSYMERVQCRQRALIFDLDEKKLLEQFAYDYEPGSDCNRCITACAAFPGNERDSIVDKNIAIEGNGVFLRDVYSAPIATRKIDTVCETQLAPTLAWNTPMETYDIGYELFHDIGRLQLDSWDYGRFRKVIKGNPDKNPRPTPKNGFITPYNNEGKVSFQINFNENTSIVGYYWIEVLTIAVDSSKTQRKIFFKKDRINYYIHSTITTSRCPFYYFGNGKVERNANAQTSYQPAGDSLQKTQIIPMRMFHTMASRLATCTYLNFAFMWKSVADGLLKKVDLFLYSLYRAVPKNLDITFGVLGDLQVNHEDSQSIRGENELFRRFPIPQKMFRLVEYEYEDGTVFQTIIIIHNEPALDQTTGRICTTEEEISGWDDIKNAGDMLGSSYACPVTRELCENLGVERGIVLTNVLRPLYLNNFPVGRIGFTDVFYTQSILPKVYAERDKLVNDRNTE